MTRPSNTSDPETAAADAAAAARTPDTRMGRYDWEKARGPIAVGALHSSSTWSGSRRTTHPRACSASTVRHAPPRRPRTRARTAALARAAENQRRKADAPTSPPVPLRLSPQQFVASAADLLDGLLAQCHALRRDHSQSPAVPVPPAR